MPRFSLSNEFYWLPTRVTISDGLPEYRWLWFSFVWKPEYFMSPEGQARFHRRLKNAKTDEDING